MMFKSDIQHCVTDIIADAIKEHHKNRLAKCWGAAVLDLVKMCLVLEYKGDAKRKCLNNWKLHWRWVLINIVVVLMTLVENDNNKNQIIYLCECVVSYKDVLSRMI